ncbi:MAG TPA: GNAT family protein [Ferruginibacter sp.]|nr:GNAT family protein [Ferruginibacter sp.]HMP22325.1 GNAT family protein [Ferruginibacter sp.]
MYRKMSNGDFSFIYGLYMHPEVNPYLLYEVMDAAAFTPVFNDLLQKEIVYVFEPKGIPCGMFKFIPGQHRNAHLAYLGGLAIHPDYAGRGMGTQLIHSVIELARSMQLLRIELTVATNNSRAIKLYENAGFEKEGVLRKFSWLLAEDRYVDEHMMSYLFR